MENLLTIDASAASHVGMVRAANTDNFLLNGRYIHDFETDSIQVSVENSGNEYLFAVSDGMDETSEDKNASISAVKELKKLQEKFRSNGKELESKVDMLRESSEELTNLIYSMTLGTNEEAVRKPSIAGLLISRSRAGIVCLGNCRVYLYRGGVMRQLVSDSKKAERLLKMGIITNDQVEMLKGTGEDGKGDSRKTEIINIRLGDTFLLCSNGVPELVDEDTLSEIISMNENSSALAEGIIKQAIRNGGDDCTTALVVKILDIPGEEETEQPQPPKTKGVQTSSAAKLRNHTVQRRKLLIKKYVSTAASILIIALLIFAAYKLLEKNRPGEPDNVSFETTQQESSYEETVSGTSDEEAFASTKPEAEGETGTDNTQDGIQKYIVKKGDSLLKISKQFYNDESKYKLIMEANDITDPDKIIIGQELKIPAAETP